MRDVQALLGTLPCSKLKNELKPSLLPLPFQGASYSAFARSLKLALSILFVPANGISSMKITRRGN
jgi:hypothetical protein